MMFAVVLAAVLSQHPSSHWRVNYEPLGMFCFKESQNPNIPQADQHQYPHSGGCKSCSRSPLSFSTLVLVLHPWMVWQL